LLTGKQLEDEHRLSTLEELKYQNEVLQLELQGVYETAQMYDYEVHASCMHPPHITSFHPLPVSVRTVSV
jgi:hypothetical protein